MNGRRVFLGLIGATAGTLALPACGSPAGSPTEASGPLSGGNISALPVGTLSVIDGQPVVIARDAMGVYAMSTICTHARCDMRDSGSISNGGLECSCHGSSFDANGVPFAGPARSVLPHWKVTIAADGSITVLAGTAVDPSVRVSAAG